jgi:hypothetical protein
MEGHLMPERKSEFEDKDSKLVLGQVLGKLDQMEKSQSRTTLALIGVIAAQIGVKVLGTPILLDIATALAIIGVVILIGAMVFKARVVKMGSPLTRTGVMLCIMMVLITITQILVYFRDLGSLNATVIYAARILQNVSILAFGWVLITDGHLYISRKKSSASNGDYQIAKHDAEQVFKKSMDAAEEIYQQKDKE